MTGAILETLTRAQLDQLQRQYLRSSFSGGVPSITDKSLETDGRKRGRVVKEAVSAGFLTPTGETTWHGKLYHITAEVMNSVVPVALALFEQWNNLHEKNKHREAYERPWIRVDDQPIEVQSSILTADDVDWYVVSCKPYEYHQNFAEAAETVIADAAPASRFNGYWAGPFALLEDAIARRKVIGDSCLAVSSRNLRHDIAHFFAERKTQWLFANNLLWGLIDVVRVPNDLLFDAEGKPQMDSQLEEGHSLRFAANPNPPSTRSEVAWEANLATSIERLKSRIAKAEEKLGVLREIKTRVEAFGGWKEFMDAMEQRLRESATVADPGADPRA